MARAPKPGIGKKLEGETDPAEDGPRLIFEVEGTVHRVWLNRLTGLDVAAIRKATGHSVNALMLMAFDADVLAAWTWIARRQNGEPRLTFEEVAETVVYGTRWKVLASDPEESDEGEG